MALRLTARTARPLLPSLSTRTALSPAHRRRTIQPPLRTMASAPEATKYEWLVVIPDKPGMLAKRLEIRPTHFANIKPREESGQWKMGGAILSEVPASADPSQLKFVGSTIIVMAADKEEVMSQLGEDVYAEKGVWDLEKAQMWPLKTAFRNP